jgi:hypothetical protein
MIQACIDEMDNRLEQMKDEWSEIGESAWYTLGTVWKRFMDLQVKFKCRTTIFEKVHGCWRRGCH